MTSVCNKPLLDVTACGNTFWLVIYVSFFKEVFKGGGTDSN